jgi:hypothetical protein
MVTTARDNRPEIRQIRAGYAWNLAGVMLIVIGSALAAASLAAAVVALAAGALCAVLGGRAWGWSAGYRFGTAKTALTLAEQITEKVAEGVVPAVKAGKSLVPWWCDEHQQHRYDGHNPCDRLHQLAPGAAEKMCGYHLRVHGPAEFGPLCRAWDDVRRAALEDDPRRRYLRWLHR